MISKSAFDQHAMAKEDRIRSEKDEREQRRRPVVDRIKQSMKNKIVPWVTDPKYGGVIIWGWMGEYAEACKAVEELRQEYVGDEYALGSRAEINTGPFWLFYEFTFYMKKL
jgi:hypothetical protein